MDYTKVIDYDYLVRDNHTGAIINTDNNPVKSFAKKFTNAVDDINILKEEISEIKRLLREIAKNNS